MRICTLLLKIIGIYLSVCGVENFLYEVNLISHYGLGKYSLIESIFLYMLILISIFLSFFLLKGYKGKKFVQIFFIYWITYGVLNEVVDLRLFINILMGNEAYVLGVNFLSQDIWLYHYIGCFVGMVIAGLHTG